METRSSGTTHRLGGEVLFLKLCPRNQRGRQRAFEARSVGDLAALARDCILRLAVLQPSQRKREELVELVWIVGLDLLEPEVRLVDRGSLELVGVLRLVEARQRLAHKLVMLQFFLSIVVVVAAVTWHLRLLLFFIRLGNSFVCNNNN